jgi:glutathione S-transferase
VTILYSFRRCPYAMRARMALIVAQIEVEHREVALRNKPDTMVAASPKGTVPVLVLANGQVIDESLDIMRWALDQHDPRGWGSAPDDAIAMIDGPFKHDLDRMKYAHRYQGADPAFHRAAATELLRPLEARLSTSPYLRGGSVSFVDMAAMPFIRQFARADMAAWQQSPLPKLQNWLDQLINSDLFSAAMVKYPVWTADRAVSKEGL